MASVLVLKNANVFNPSPLGLQDILCIGGKVIKVGTVIVKHLEALELPIIEIDLKGDIVVPGIIDPHEHIIGGSGESGYRSRSPEISLHEIVKGGITTVVGCIGVDTVTRNMRSLLAQAKLFNEEGITAYVWSGGYPIPPKILTSSIEEDMILVDEVIGLGEIAISDYRSSEPEIRELARVVVQAYNGGMLTGKAGVTHFHLGNGKFQLRPLIELLEQFDIQACSIYPTHVNRNSDLLRQAAAASKNGMMVDFDVSDFDLIPSLQHWLDYGGDFNNLTLSSDASYAAPATLFEQIKEALVHFKWPLEKLLPLVTKNTARILKLSKKGAIQIGADADFVCLEQGSLKIMHVIAGGKFFVRDSELVYRHEIMEKSNRIRC